MTGIFASLKFRRPNNLNWSDLIMKIVVRHVSLNFSYLGERNLIHNFIHLFHLVTRAVCLCTAGKRCWRRGLTRETMTMSAHLMLGDRQVRRQCHPPSHRPPLAVSTFSSSHTSKCRRLLDYLTFPTYSFIRDLLGYIKCAVNNIMTGVDDRKK